MHGCREKFFLISPAVAFLIAVAHAYYCPVINYTLFC